jgi:hypothetical protein
MRTLPGRLVDFEAGNRGLKVAWICKAMGAQGAEFRQLKLRTKDFLNVCVRWLWYAIVHPGMTYIRGPGHLGALP